MKKVFYTCILGLIASSLFAQNQQKTISGTVKDNQNETIIGATVTLLKVADSSLVKKGITNNDGQFQFSNLLKDNYLVTISSVGFKPYKSLILKITDAQNAINLPVIILLPAKTELKEMVVVSKRPLLEHDIDKTIVNVDAMISSATSNTLEVLEKTPGVTVDENGSISLNGKNGVLVLIDGRATHMSGQDLTAYLKSLPGGILDKIELMDNPPAKYEAAGSAIINIRLKRNRTRGLTGNLSMSYSQGEKARTYNVLNLNFNRKKWNWFGNIGYNVDGNYGRDTYNRRFYNTDAQLNSQVNLLNNSSYTSRGLVSRLGFDFNATAKTTIGGQVYFQTRPRLEAVNFESKTYTPIFSLDSVNTGFTNGDFDWNTQEANLNFQHKFNDKGHELSGDFNAIRYDSDGNQIFENFINARKSNDFRYDLLNGIGIYNFKMDYAQPLKNKMLFEAGIKSSVVNNDNDSQNFEGKDNVGSPNFNKSNHFIFQENINAAYLNTRKNWKRVGVQVGLRLENTQLKGNLLANVAVKETVFTQNFTDVFPTTFFSYKLDSLGKNNLSFSFAQRINRPNYQQFNPFLAFRDNYSYTTGNPELKPQYQTRFELNYQRGQLLRMGLQYGLLRDVIFSTTEAVNSIFISKSNNIANASMLILSTNLTLNPAKWWRLNANLGVGRLTLKSKIYTENLDITVYSSRIFMLNQCTFKNGWSSEMTVQFSAKDPNGQTVTNPRYRVFAAVQKKVLKDKGSLKLSFEDIFHSWIQVDNSLAIKQSEQFHQNETDTQRIGLAFTYRFGSEKFLRKRRYMDNAAESEKGRVE